MGALTGNSEQNVLVRIARGILAYLVEGMNPRLTQWWPMFNKAQVS